MTSTEKPASISFRTTILSLPSEADLQCLRIRNALASNGLSRFCFPVELLARECLINALNHGNHRDPDKVIELRFSVGRHWIRLQVSDEGPGFCWRKALEQIPDTNATSGRGVQLCAMYADRIQFNRRGNQITLWIDKRNYNREG